MAGLEAADIWLGTTLPIRAALTILTVLVAFILSNRVGDLYRRGRGDEVGPIAVLARPSLAALGYGPEFKAREPEAARQIERRPPSGSLRRCPEGIVFVPARRWANLGVTPIELRRSSIAQINFPKVSPSFSVLRWIFNSWPVQLVTTDGTALDLNVHDVAWVRRLFSEMPG
ncbi:MAG TPA: hypothetical protein VHV31_05540 [Nitrolancea sp.]|nr:hypothetical protein [Nitrolancea sp.]